MPTSSPGIQQLIDKWRAEASFDAALRVNIKDALDEAGISLSPVELASLKVYLQTRAKIDHDIAHSQDIPGTQHFGNPC
jgi:hypothetical protein